LEKLLFYPLTILFLIRTFTIIKLSLHKYVIKGKKLVR
jgi:hypothetical protein